MIEVLQLVMTLYFTVGVLFALHAARDSSPELEAHCIGKSRVKKLIVYLAFSLAMVLVVFAWPHIMSDQMSDQS